MSPFPVHTDHSSESPVALDRFNEHGHRPEALPGDQQFQRLEAHDQSQELEPSGDTASSFNTLLLLARFVRSS